MNTKFRGLSIDENSKGEWQYGHLIEDSGRAFIINEVIEANEQYITIGSWDPVRPDTVSQSTGLRDKNDMEIFEGDILKFNDEWADYGYEGYVDGSIDGINYVEIKAETTYFTFGETRIPESSLTDLVENEHYPFEELVNEKSYEFEIIGNIYENPELLEDSDND